LQKAEAFLQRRIIKARDACDIFLLFEVGADLSSKLHAHLEDSLHAEFDADTIKTRIGQLTGKLCQRELQPLLPPKIYGPWKRPISNLCITKKHTRYATYNIAGPEKALLDLVYLSLQEGFKPGLDELDFSRIDRTKLSEHLALYPASVRAFLLPTLVGLSEVA